MKKVTKKSSLTILLLNLSCFFAKLSELAPFGRFKQQIVLNASKQVNFTQNYRRAGKSILQKMLDFSEIRLLLKAPF